MCSNLILNFVTVIIIALNNFFLQLGCVVLELNRKSGKKVKSKKVKEEVKFTFHNRAMENKVRIVCTCDSDLSVIHGYILLYMHMYMYTLYVYMYPDW